MGRHRHGQHHMHGTPVASGIPRYIEPVVLLLLRMKGVSYGYELAAECTELSITGEPIDAGSIYKVLKRMEMEGLVMSRWEFRQAGAPRKHYRITGPGTEVLNTWMEELKRRRGAIDRLVTLYEGLST